jgi:type IV pilus assembly protein PilY1
MTTSTNNPDGWVLNFPASSVVTTVSPVPTTRNVSETSVIGGIFFGTAYSPDPDLCAAEGLSSLYGVYYLTGTPISTAQVFGQDTTHTYVLSNVSLGAGLASSPSLQIAKGLGNSQAEIYTQTSTGAIVQTGATLANNTTSGEISWQQPNQ